MFNLIFGIINFFIILYNRIIGFLKYPIAILLFLSLPFLITKIANVIILIIKYKEFYYPLFIGGGLYFLIWIIFLRKLEYSLFVTVAEHEITHALFAIFTGKLVREFIIKNSIYGYRYGYISFQNKYSYGNWIITIAPYFFSTFSVIILGLMYLSKNQFFSILLGLFGFTLIHYIHSISSSIHRWQSDLQEVGFPFVVLFLPGAILSFFIASLALIPQDKIVLSIVIDNFYKYHLSIFLMLKDSLF